MRKIPSSFLRAGMEIASHIYALDGRVLLAKGVKLTAPYIRRLIDKGIPYVYIEDDISRDIVISDIILDETRLQAKNHINKVIHNYSNIDYSETKSIVNDIICQMLSNRDIIFDLEDIRSVDDYLFSHSVNVCVLSVMIGISLKYNIEQLEKLAVGAILHDIGKCLIPSHILQKPGKLTPDEFQEMKQHPKYSLDILRLNDSVHSVSRIIAYQHHERYNGEGYPLGISGKEILEMSQIVGMADMYDAITSSRCYRDAMPPNEAYELLAGAGDYYFRFDIIKEFLYRLVAYPTGTIVELSTDMIAIVVKNTIGYPTKPKVRLLTNSDMTPLDFEEELNLIDKKNISIKRVLKEIEILQVNNLIKSNSTKTG